MSSTVRLCLALHNHQPVGNFDHVFQQAYFDSYSLFLDVFEPFTELKISLHTSGPLMEWLDREHPEYLERLTALVHAGRVEILGGPFYEPILTMIPRGTASDKSASTAAGWKIDWAVPCRACGLRSESGNSRLTRDLAVAGMRYTILDDAHFQAAGLRKEAVDRIFHHGGRGPAVERFSRQRAVAVQHPVSRAAGDDRLPPRHGSEVARLRVRLRGRWREIRRLARNAAACLRRWLVASLLRDADGTSGLVTDLYVWRRRLSTPSRQAPSICPMAAIAR